MATKIDDYKKLPRALQTWQQQAGELLHKPSMREFYSESFIDYITYSKFNARTFLTIYRGTYLSIGKIENSDDNKIILVYRGGEVNDITNFVEDLTESYEERSINNTIRLLEKLSEVVFARQIDLNKSNAGLRNIKYHIARIFEAELVI